MPDARIVHELTEEAFAQSEHELKLRVASLEEDVEIYRELLHRALACAHVPCAFGALTIVLVGVVMWQEQELQRLRAFLMQQDRAA